MKTSPKGMWELIPDFQKLESGDVGSSRPVHLLRVSEGFHHSPAREDTRPDETIEPFVLSR
jgi:hypothetical protein